MAECIEPGGIDQEDIVAYVSGEATPEVCDHIARCAACQAEATSYAGLQDVLLAGLYRMDCPPVETLGAFAASRLRGKWKREVSEHLASCVLCREELETIREYDVLAREGSLTEVIGDLVKVITARPLTLDMQMLHPARDRLAYIPLRQGDWPGHNETRHLYRAEELGMDIMLTLLRREQGGGPRTLVGQLIAPLKEEPYIVDEKEIGVEVSFAEALPPSFEGAIAELWGDGQKLDEVPVSTSGGFTIRLASLPETDKYEVRIRIGGSEIRGLWMEI